MIDLFEKYMKHIQDEFGDTFADSNKFTLEEKRFLKKMEMKINSTDCLCKYDVTKNGDIVKVKQCNFHKL